MFLSSAPAAVALEFLAPERHTALFVLSILAIVPLAGYIGRATDELAEHFGGAVGGLLNATFGNVAEVIIGALALRAGFTDLVKASQEGCRNPPRLIYSLCLLPCHGSRFSANCS